MKKTKNNVLWQVTFDVQLSDNPNEWYEEFWQNEVLSDNDGMNAVTKAKTALLKERFYPTNDEFGTEDKSKGKIVKVADIRLAELRQIRDLSNVIS